MSTITGLGSNLGSIYAALNQQLFKSIDQNADGSVSQAELEQAVTGNGGTTQSADQLYAALDPQGNGSVDEQQFVTGLQSLLSSQTQGALIQAQSDAPGTQGATPHPHGDHHHGGHMQQLFNSIDSNGDGSIDQSELEQAFSAAGGSTQEADQLFAQLDPNGTGSINEQQFASGLGSLLRQANSTAAGAAAPSQGGGETVDISIQITETGTAAPAAPTDASGTADAGQAASGAGAGGSGAAAAQSTTEITYNADGTITTTVTNPDGTKTVTTTGTPNNSASGSGGNGSTAAGALSLDKLLSDFFSVGRQLASGSLSSATLGQLLGQQQTS